MTPEELRLYVTVCEQGMSRYPVREGGIYYCANPTDKEIEAALKAGYITEHSRRIHSPDYPNYVYTAVGVEAYELLKLVVKVWTYIFG